MLAAIALCLGTTILLKMALGGSPPAQDQAPPTLQEKAAVRARRPGPITALVTLIPLFWLVAATFTAGAQKIWHSDPKIGFLAQAQELAAKAPALRATLETARTGSDAATVDAAEKAVNANRTLRFNNLLDAVVTGLFLALVGAILLMSVREWILLLARKKVAELHETPPVWLPHFAAAESRPIGIASLLALAFALAKELSGEAALERNTLHANADCCQVASGMHGETRDKEAARERYLQVTEQRFNGIRRCC
jgi:carbon starvation protein